MYNHKWLSIACGSTPGIALPALRLQEMRSPVYPERRGALVAFEETSMDLVAFYRGEAPDYMGRRLEELLSWDDDLLEMIHNYIQVLFPLREPSMFSYHAPLLDDAIVTAFHADEDLRANLAGAFERMLSFYGFRFDAESGKVLRTAEFVIKTRNWISPFNHNYRRITRILTCMTTLGLDEMARAFLDALTELYQERRSVIGPETFRFWQSAVNG
jgi:hypothetical protein